MAELVRTGELARFLPQQVAEGLLGGQLHAEGSFERRRITVLFADMVGFTDLSESLEPEELAEVLNGYLREMTAAVIAHGGSLDNFIGDGVMAVFGAPQELPESEQAWAAVEAAMEMRERCHALAASLRERGIPADPEIRVGLNTAHCTVGVFGSDVMRAYKAVGFGVNVAARLQTAAEPGSILCGFRTYALVKERVTAEERGALIGLRDGGADGFDRRERGEQVLARGEEVATIAGEATETRQRLRAAGGPWLGVGPLAQFFDRFSNARQACP